MITPKMKGIIIENSKWPIAFRIQEYFLNIKRINKATIQNYARYGFDPSLIVPTAKEDPKKMTSKQIKEYFSLNSKIEYLYLPSTSPANTTMKYDPKLMLWKDALQLC